MRVLVTGATGLVGSHLVDHLLETGSPVRVAIRRAGVAEALRARGAETWLGDLADTTDLTGAVAGVDVVVHCAGSVQIAASRADVWNVNVGGTERLAAASVREGVSRFVYLSSVAVYGHVSPPVREEGPKQPAGGYGESKWAAEESLWGMRADHGLPVVALRPCAIYGPRDRHAWPALSRMAGMRIIPLPGGGTRVLDLVYVSDVVDATLAAATNPTAVGHAYNITDGETHTYRDILAAAAQISGRRPAILPVPGRVFGAALGIVIRAMQLMGMSSARVAQVARLRALDVDIHFPIDAARRDLGYAPRVGLAEGVRRTISWEREQRSHRRAR